MREILKVSCYKCSKNLTVKYSGKTIFRTCNGCGRKNRIDGTGEGKPAYTLSPKSRIGA